jgi:hypothetical protein
MDYLLFEHIFTKFIQKIRKSQGQALVDEQKVTSRMHGLG